MTTRPVRVTAPTRDSALQLVLTCDGLSCEVVREDGSWHVTIDRADDPDATVPAVLDAIQQWLRFTGVPKTWVDLGDERYLMTRESP